jgi:hypothetical protein
MRSVRWTPETGFIRAYLTELDQDYEGGPHQARSQINAITREESILMLPYDQKVHGRPNHFSDDELHTRRLSSDPYSLREGRW